MSVFQQICVLLDKKFSVFEKNITKKIDEATHKLCKRLDKVEKRHQALAVKVKSMQRRGKTQKKQEKTQPKQTLVNFDQFQTIEKNSTKTLEKAIGQVNCLNERDLNLVFANRRRLYPKLFETFLENQFVKDENLTLQVKGNRVWYYSNQWQIAESPKHFLQQSLVKLWEYYVLVVQDCFETKDRSKLTEKLLGELETAKCQLSVDRFKQILSQVSTRTSEVRKQTS